MKFRQLLPLKLCLVLPVFLLVPMLKPASGLAKLPASDRAGTDIYLPLIQNHPPVLVPDTTKVLTEDTMQYLTSVSANGREFTFAQRTPTLDGLVPGDVIVSEPTDITPYGFLRMVTDVVLGEQVVVITEEASLEDAIRQGGAQLAYEPDPDDIQGARLNKGVTLSPDTEAAAGVFSINMSRVVLYDHDGNQNTTYDQITADGSVIVDPNLDFELFIQNWRLEQLYFALSGTEETNLTISSNVDLAAVSREVTVAVYTLKPIVMSIGPVPVVLLPILTVTVSVDGTVSVGISANVAQSVSIMAGVHYQNEVWEPLSNFGSQFQFTPPEQVEVEASMKGEVRGQASLLLYGVTDIYARVATFLELEVDLTTLPPCPTLSGGLGASAGVELRLLSSVVADYHVVLIENSRVLAMCEPITLELQPLWVNNLTVTVRGVVTSSNTIERLHWQWGDGESGDQWFPAVHTYDTSGTYMITATAYDELGNTAVKTTTVDFAPLSYMMIDLGTLGGPHSSASAINDAGQVVGTSHTSLGYKHAFLWEDGVMIDLGTLGGLESEAHGINNLGQVVGWSQVSPSTSNYHAFLWENGVMIDLGTLGGFESSASAINDQGQIVGWTTTSVGNVYAFLWENGVMNGLGTLGGSQSVARNLNEAGQVVGWSQISPSASNDHAFLWEDWVMTDIGSLAVGDTSYARDINEAGQVVGWSVTTDGSYHAFLWENGMMTDLNIGDSGVTAVNNLGQVVGWSQVSNHAILWKNGAVIDLGSFGGWSIAMDINEAGQVVGWSETMDGNYRAFLAIPNSQ